MPQLLSLLTRPNTFKRVLNMGLRLGALATKMLLTFYMARYLGLAELGTYGLVAAAVAIAIPFLGLRTDYVISREMVQADELQIARLMRDQMVFYGLNYLLLIVVVLLGMLWVPHQTGSTLIMLTLTLSILESFCTVTSSNFIFLGRPLLCNVVFFFRAAAWVFPVVALGIYQPSTRSIVYVFGFWLGGIVVSLVITAYALRHIPWKQIIATVPVDWQRMRSNAGKCIPIWLGSVGAIAAGNLDRFVVEHNLSRDLVGVISFYGSFVAAISTLTSSGIGVFKQPHLIATHRAQDTPGFHRVARTLAFQSGVFCSVLALAFGLLVPTLSSVLHKPQLAFHASVLWLMLIGVWLRVVTDVLPSVMYARHQDSATWQGNLLLLLVAYVSNATLVPLIGLNGVGYASIIAGVFAVVWNAYHVVRWKDTRSALVPVENGNA